MNSRKYPRSDISYCCELHRARPTFAACSVPNLGTVTLTVSHESPKVKIVWNDVTSPPSRVCAPFAIGVLHAIHNTSELWVKRTGNADSVCLLKLPFTLQKHVTRLAFGTAPPRQRRHNLAHAGSCCDQSD